MSRQPESIPAATCSRCGAHAGPLAVGKVCKRKIDHRKQCGGHYRSTLRPSAHQRCDRCNGSGVMQGAPCVACEGVGSRFVG